MMTNVAHSMTTHDNKKTGRSGPELRDPLETRSNSTCDI